MCAKLLITCVWLLSSVDFQVIIKASFLCKTFTAHSTQMASKMLLKLCFSDCINISTANRSLYLKRVNASSSSLFIRGCRPALGALPPPTERKRGCLSNRRLKSLPRESFSALDCLVRHNRFLPAVTEREY